MSTASTLIFDQMNTDEILARLASAMSDRHPRPTIEEYRAAFAAYIRRGLILARIDEARRVSSKELTDRVKQLAVELAKCDAEIKYAPR